MSIPTAVELREALAGTSDEFFYPREHVILDAARLALAVLEQGEEMEWCETHNRAADHAWVDGDARVLVCNMCDQTGVLGRMVPSLRIPSAVLDPAKNEEEPA